jgi:MurNAc alpha-1-phosphate uridylyltransferase
MTTRAAMILAAGFGTRMGALTRDRPKPLLEVAGRPLLDHAIAAAGGASPLVVNGHYRADQIRAFLSAHHPDAIFVEEAPAILESGGGIKHALPHLGQGPVLTLNADAVWSGPAPSDILAAQWDPARMQGLLLLVPRNKAVGRDGGGDFLLGPDGRLTWDKGAETLVYTGAQIITTARIAAHRDTVFSLREVWRDMIADGGLFGCVYPGVWADVGHPAGIGLAEGMLRDAV